MSDRTIGRRRSESQYRATVTVNLSCNPPWFIHFFNKRRRRGKGKERGRDESTVKFTGKRVKKRSRRWKDAARRASDYTYVVT